MKTKLTRQEKQDLSAWIRVWQEMTGTEISSWWPDLLASDPARLCEIAKSLHHLYEVECSYPMTKRQESRMTNLEAEAQAIADRYGLRLLIDGDPRALPLGLYTREKIGSYNSWDSETWRCPML
jgi:hypothetical protein